MFYVNIKRYKNVYAPFYGYKVFMKHAVPENIQFFPFLNEIKSSVLYL